MMNKDFLTIKNNCETTIIINKSTFIGSLYYVETIDEVNEYLTKHKEKHLNANHNCYAYIVNNQQKASDDGEPAGTAGVPILEVLKKNEIENVLAIVTRYFGGIKLGAGGLVRAYSKSITNTLAENEIVKRVKTTIFEISFDYNYLDIVNNYIQQIKLNVYNKQFLDRIIFNCNDLSEETIEKLKSITNYEITIMPLSTTYEIRS